MTIFDHRICHITYTHTDYSDVWPIYFSQMKKFFCVGMKHVVAVDKTHKELPSSVQPIFYDESDAYPRRLLSCLERLDAFEYVFFDHEDMFLYGTPDLYLLQKYYAYLVSGKIDHIRMIKGGDCEYKEILDVPSLFRIDLNSAWIFSIQPSFWRRTTLMDLLNSNQKINIWNFEAKSQKAAKKLKLRAAFSHRQGAKRGIYHFDNDVYPYIATAIVKGRWNLSEYPRELGLLLEENAIDPSFRGYS